MNFHSVVYVASGLRFDVIVQRRHFLFRLTLRLSPISCMKTFGCNVILNIDLNNYYQRLWIGADTVILSF